MEIALSDKNVLHKDFTVDKGQRLKGTLAEYAQSSGWG